MSLKKVLAIPSVYRLFRYVVGSDSARQRYADLFIRAPSAAKVLDIGCGTGDILKFLPSVDYMGFDISPDYIESAKRNFGDRGQFFCEPVSSGIDVPELSFDVALAHGVLHHLNDAEAIALFSIAHRSLKPGGRLITFDGCLTEDQSYLAKFFVSRDRGQFVRDRTGYEELARKSFSDVQVNIRHDLIRLPYTHIVMECRK